MQGDVSWVAIPGAVTATALTWNLWRDVRARARLNARSFVFHQHTDDGDGPDAMIAIANTGTIPAYIHEVTV